MIRRGTLLVALAGAVLVSAVLVVDAKHRARGLQNQLQELRVTRDQHKTEWAQLRLEESAWGNPDRVGRIVNQRLQMHQPRDYVVLESQP